MDIDGRDRHCRLSAPSPDPNTASHLLPSQRPTGPHLEPSARHVKGVGHRLAHGARHRAAAQAGHDAQVALIPQAWAVLGADGGVWAEALWGVHPSEASGPRPGSPIQQYVLQYTLQRGFGTDKPPGALW